MIPAPSVIYIASTGRSGSTLLELLLNSQERVWSMGEIYALPWEADRNGRCGCGSNLQDCPFWRPVIGNWQRFSERRPHISKFREYPNGGPFIRPMHLFNLLAGARIGNDTELSRFCEENRTLFEEIHVRAGIRKETHYLIDASKDFYRFDWLSRCQKIPLKVVHLVRDPRAYVYSNLKGVGNDRALKIRRALRMSLKYTVENALIESAARRLPEEDRYFLRYEDLVLDPTGTVKRICEWLHIPFSGEAAAAFREQENHAVAGNQTRHLKTGIQPDRAWRRNLEPGIQKMVLFIARTRAGKYGYA